MVLQERWLGLIDETIQQLTDGFVDVGSVEFVHTFAVPLPITIITRMLGVPNLSIGTVKAWSDAIMSALDPGRPNWVDKARAEQEMAQLFRRELEERLYEPRRDVLSELAEAVVDGVDGEKITLEEALDLVYLLFVAGNETITQLLSGMMLHLARSGTWNHLRTNPELISGVVEEALRIYNPILGMMRFVREDVTLNGVDIPAGSVVHLSYAGANNDAAMFPEPRSFIPDRDNADRNVSFGYGIHHCLGAPLARLEAVRTLHHLVTRFDTLTIAEGEQPEFDGASQLIRGMSSLPLSFRPIRRAE
jgi:cytochrome P450